MRVNECVSEGRRFRQPDHSRGRRRLSGRRPLGCERRNKTGLNNYSTRTGMRTGTPGGQHGYAREIRLKRGVELVTVAAERT